MQNNKDAIEQQRAKIETMKKWIFFIAVSLSLPLWTAACDICGCGVGNSYIGILPDFNKRIFGLRYRYNSIFSHIGTGGASTYLTTNEKYRTIELWGGWNISENFRLMASVPYSFNEQVNQGITKSKNGLGDVSVSGMYQLINKRKPVAKDRLLVQSLWVGGGVKLPTGKYNPSDKSVSSNNANLFQLGTGSIDFTLTAMYDIRLQDAGVNVSASYKVNTANKQEYRYGNKLNGNLQAYYKFRIQNKVTIAPNTGLLVESGQQDMDNQFSVYVSGGNVLLGTIGVETSFKKFSFGGNWQTPFSQNLAHGIVKANNRMMLHLSFLL